MRTAAGSLIVPWRKFLGAARASGNRWKAEAVMSHAGCCTPECSSGELAAPVSYSVLPAPITLISATNLALTTTFLLI